MASRPAAVTIDDLIALIADQSVRRERLVVAIGGPPAAGKSTLAAELADALPDRVAVVGLDGFHYDDAVLAEREQLSRKGAPFTFDVDGYRRCLQTLIENRDVDVAVPVFDRELELSRNSAQVVSADRDVIVTEGNYLLLNRGGWSALRPLFDITVFATAPLAVVQQRIIARWLGYGFSPDEAEERAQHNDLPNAETVFAESAPADYEIDTSP